MSAAPGFNWQDELARHRRAQLDIFGVPVIYERPGTEPFTVRVIPNAPAALEDTNPAFRRVHVLLSDFAAPYQAPANGDLVTLGGVVHEVQKVGPDIAGMVALTLNQTARDPNA